MYKNYFIASTLLLGTIIGAGIFTLPQVFHKSGLFLGLGYLVVFGVLTSFVHLMYAEIVLRTKEVCELAGCTKIYLGDTLGRVVKVTQVVGNAGTLIAYQILGAEFLRLIIPMLPLHAETVLFWALGGAGLVFGANTIAKGELLTNGFIFVIVVAMLIFGLPYWDTLVWSKEVSQPFLPYGVVLYALIGQQAVREVITYLRRRKTRVQPFPFIVASISSVVFCFVFALAVLLLYQGEEPPINVFRGLLATLPVIGILGGLLGFANMLDSFWTIGTYFRNVFINDIKANKFIGLFLALTVPLVGGVLLRGQLLRLLDVLGGIFVGFEILVILFLWRKARRMSGGEGVAPDFSLSIHPLFFWGLVVLFSGGLLYKVFHIFA